MSLIFTNARVVTPERIINGGVVVNGDTITKVFSGDGFDAEGERIDCGGSYLTPGFVDIHIHGAYEASFFDSDCDSINRATAYHARFGTTSLLATTASGSRESISNSVKNIAACMEKGTDGARILGAHLEGCYFNPKTAGAQNPAFLYPPEEKDYMPLVDTGIIRRISASPEVEGVLDMARKLAPTGILFSVGHSDADYEWMMKALDAGFTHVTHIYNAQSMLSNCYFYPQVGVCESALLHDEFTVEAICDGRHIPWQLLRLMYKIKGADRFHAITDAVFSGAPDGPIEEFGMKCLVEDSVCMLESRVAFAGSVATGIRMLRTLVNEAQVPVCDAVKMCSLTPAKQIHADDMVGRIAPGLKADINIINSNIELEKTYIGGRLYK